MVWPAGLEAAGLERAFCTTTLRGGADFRAPGNFLPMAATGLRGGAMLWVGLFARAPMVGGAKIDGRQERPPPTGGSGLVLLADEHPVARAHPLMRRIQWAVLLVSLSRSRAAPTDERRGRQLLDFDVCGKFCGPGWCNGGWHSEWNADPTHCGPHYGPPQISPHTGEPACADACCRAHDMCCAPGGDNLPESINKTRLCNRKIVECLDTCSGLDFSCKRGFVGVPADVVWAAMDLVEDWCCGHPCPKPDDAVVIQATSKTAAEGQAPAASVSLPSGSAPHQASPTARAAVEVI